jgi:anti-sigma B factor antagonist
MRASASLPVMPSGSALPTFTREPLGQLELIAVHGELDRHSVPRLRAVLREAVAQQPGRLLLDLEGVSYLDSVALTAIIAAWRALVRRGGALVVVCTAAIPRRLIAATRVDELIDVYGSRAEALTQLTS